MKLLFNRLRKVSSICKKIWQKTTVLEKIERAIDWQVLPNQIQKTI